MRVVIAADAEEVAARRRQRRDEAGAGDGNLRVDGRQRTPCCCCRHQRQRATAAIDVEEFQRLPVGSQAADARQALVDEGGKPQLSLLQIETKCYHLGPSQ